jgi:hypothetical protein
MSDVIELNRGTMDIHHLSTHGLLMLYQAVKLAINAARISTASIGKWLERRLHVRSRCE